jgi:hypothetical protein
MLQQPTVTPTYDPKTTLRHFPNLPPPSTTCFDAI